MIICIHAHHSNIEWLEKTLSEYQLKHIVIENLVQVKNPSEVKKQVRQKLHALAANDVTCFVSTCTYFSAYLPGNNSIPIIALDELLFKSIAHEPIIQLAFTNEGTIHATLARYEKFKNPNQEFSVHLIDDAFDKVMSGDLKAYKEIVEKGLGELNQQIPIVAAQLSMEIAIRKNDISCLSLLKKEVLKYQVK